VATAIELELINPTPAGN